jgi:hypothetical protein
MRRAYVLFLLATVSLGPVLLYGQDDGSPSLGDVSRQARLAKQQKDGQADAAVPGQVSGKPAATVSRDSSSQSVPATAAQSGAQNKTRTSSASPTAPVKPVPSAKPAKRVITNEDIGAAHSLTGSSPASKPSSAQAETSEQADGKNPPEYWTNQILAQKSAIASLKSDIDQLTASIQYAPGNCVEGCVEWNQHQQEKQQQVDGMKSQLEEMQKQLEETQEAARKQGYGSSVYDP